MTFGQSIKTCFSKYVTFSGRATRSEYWWFALLCFIVGCIPVVNLLSILLFLPALAVGVRRMHDIGKSGLFVLLALIPVVNLFYLYLCILESQPGANKWGEATK
ncbi:MAG: DUF805 domain-containing protein [Bacteroidaceae bacterium]|nr:DUF805 domain-containing protein [Bacteroidaceae bacterium]